MILLEAQTPSTVTVVGLGIGTVFFGLICLIAICYLLGFIMTKLSKSKADKEPATADAVTATAVNAPASEPIVNRQELIAAVSAVIAEELGQDVEAIRIKSIKKL
ncbi:MAG: OadG family protein [Oscillospiraceae bacterium]|nr:OadG family protein [Oscillospiraceae bacterium]